MSIKDLGYLYTDGDHEEFSCGLMSIKDLGYL